MTAATRLPPLRLLLMVVGLALSACVSAPPSPKRTSPQAAPPAAAPAPPTKPQAPLAIATADEVRECRLVGRLGSLGPRMGETAEESFSRTRAEVLARARKDGATHLVWGDARFPSSPASSIAQAYRCGR